MWRLVDVYSTVVDNTWPSASKGMGCSTTTIHFALFTVGLPAKYPKLCYTISRYLLTANIQGAGLAPGPFDSKTGNSFRFRRNVAK